MTPHMMEKIWVGQTKDEWLFIVDALEVVRRVSPTANSTTIQAKQLLDDIKRQLEEQEE